LERRLATARDALNDATAQVQRAAEELTAARDSLHDAQDEAIDPAPIRGRLQDLEETNHKIRQEAAETNRKVRANQAHAQKVREVEGHRANWQAYTDHLASVRQARTDRLAAAKWPIPGLSISEDGSPLYNDIPLSQVSQAEQLRISMALALANEPEIPVVLIRDGSLLDDDSMGLVLQLAEERDAQVWVERVGAREPETIIRIAKILQSQERDILALRARIVERVEKLDGAMSKRTFKQVLEAAYPGKTGGNQSTRSRYLTGARKPSLDSLQTICERSGCVAVVHPGGIDWYSSGIADPDPCHE